MTDRSNRFIRVMKEGSSWNTLREIWIDRQTGVNYLWVASGYAGGLTPLLDPRGYPIVTAIPRDDRDE